MGKRRLNDRQQRAVARIQQRRLERAEHRRASHSASDSSELGNERQGLVVANYGVTVDVETSDGNVYRCNQRQNIAEITCGDHVIWQPGAENTGVVVALQPRHSLLCRPDFQNRIKLIAANIDQIFIVTAPQPQISTGLIDRYLVAAEHFGFAPVIVINKSDLISADEQDAIEATVTLYRQLGYGVLYTSAHQEHGLDALIQQLRDHTSIFVGHSGVGKSSLAQALLPSEAIRVGALSEATGKGTHTTTVSRLYHLASGGDIIDSPGIREFGLWEITPEQVTQGFVEFRPLLGQCRFRNCSHRHEPGCALRDAEQQGIISPQRLESYFRILESLTD